MSLVGNLEDLSLPDILQIVSLSRKSGILTLEREGRQGRIFIRDGRVIQTVSPRAGKTLGEILTSRGLIRAGDLRKALELQKSGDRKELLGIILVRLGLIKQGVLEKVVQEQIEEAIVFFLSWREGTFSFELCDVESRGEISVDPHAFILERGIDTQWLVLEGTRMLDERRRQGGGADESAAPADERRPESGPSAAGGVIVVDDDPVFRDQAAERLGRLGYKVLSCDGTEEALKAVRDFPEASPPAVVTDIVYPTSDGRGFLGGLELAEKLRREHPEVPVVAITAYPDENVRGKVRELGVGQFLVKPAGTEKDGERALKKFFDDLARALSAVRAAGEASPAAEERAPAAPEREKIVEAIGEKKAEIAREESRIRKEAGEEDLDRDEMALLQNMIQELQNPKASSELGLLILRFAAELLNRAVLFVVKGGNAVGLGGFGVEVSPGARPGGVRGMTVPLDEPSILEEVVRRKAAYRGPVVHTAGNVRLMERLGGQSPAEAVAIPLVASGKVRVVLYGDNLPGNQPLPGTRAIEIFLGQAGLTLERILLEKRIQDGGGPRARRSRREERDQNHSRGRRFGHHPLSHRLAPV